MPIAWTLLPETSQAVQETPIRWRYKLSRVVVNYERKLWI